MRHQDAKRHRSEAPAVKERPLSPETALARELRRSSTDAERKLWSHLRARQLRNTKFRRQQPLSSYVVDFCSLEPKLVVEVDGGQHAEQVEADAARTKELERMGYCVIRFWNNEVLQNVEGVLYRIGEEIDRLLASPGK